MPIRYMWVGDRTPRQSLCMWCQEVFQTSGYIHDPNTGLAYCSPECCDIHCRITETYITSYNKLEDMARQIC